MAGHDLSGSVDKRLLMWVLNWELDESGLAH